MNSRSKSASFRGAARPLSAKPTGGRARRAATPSSEGDPSALAPDERDDEIDCQRIVRGEGSRSLPLYYDDYN